MIQPEIAKYMGVTDGTICYWFDKHDLEADLGSTISRRRLSEKAKQVLLDEHRLKVLYWQEGMRSREIAETLDCAKNTVLRWMGKHGIERRDRYDANHGKGRENAKWKGGKRYYGPNWQEQKEKRLEKDGDECVVCGMDAEEHIDKFNNAIHVHHIQPLRSFKAENGVYDIDYEEANKLENLITLCHKCHKKWEGVPLRPSTH
jgi:predicted HNH restriction endonuclease